MSDPANPSATRSTSHRVLLFAHLAEAIGAREVQVTLGAESTVDDALDALAAEYPAVAAMRDRVAVALDERYAGPEDIIEGGAVVALIPPVSGG